MKSPRETIDLNKIGHGAMFKGSRGFVICDFTSRTIVPIGDDADLTYYRTPTKETVLPAMGNFQQQFLKACRGDLKTSCNFEYAGNMIEMMMLGLVAYRAGKRLEYDGAAGKVTNDAAANELLARKYRDGWKLVG